MAKKSKYKPRLYKAYLEEQASANEITAAAQEHEVPEDKIVIEKVRTFPRVLKILTDVIKLFLKVIVVIIISLLSSIGLTVILNTGLRTSFIEFIKNFI